MSHRSLAAIWTQLEKRADLTTTLCDAVGQYAIQTASCGKDYSTRGSIPAFNRLINIVRTAFHLQRSYLQSSQPSPNIEPFLIEPSLIIEILVFLLTVKDDYIPVRQDLRSVGEKILRSIGAVLLAGLRLLTLYKNKVVIPLDLDWASKAHLLEYKLANWPLEDRVHRILIRELCRSFLKALSTTAEAPLTVSVKPLCEHHDNHSGAEDDVDLPDFNDGLYPLKPELRDVISRALNCIGCQCPLWFQSFCALYDIWSALIGASVQLYRRMTETNKDASDETLVALVIYFISEVETCERASNSGRFAAIHETFFGLNPFPQCSANSCSCFGSSLHHHYQELQYPGVWQQASTDVIELQLHIAMALERRKHSLRDADAYIHQVAKNMQDSVRDWTSFPEEDALELGQLKTYIINCPELHPLTSQVLGQLLENMRQESAAEDVQGTAELVQIDGLQCPSCKKPFTQARLVKPLNVLDQKLNDAPHLNFNLQEPSLEIKRSPDRSKRISETSRSLHSSSSRSMLETLPGVSSTHSRKGSSENTSQSSSKGKLSSIFRSGSSSSRLHISSVLFTDGKFVLAFTSNRISCYDCELETWSEGHSFQRITLVAGSSVRYAVVSKETHTYKLTVFRRDHILEEEEWSKHFEKQPLSIAFPQQGHRVALGFDEGVQLYDGTTGNPQILPPAIPQNGKADLQFDSQSLSFSPCGNHLVVASRAARKGKVFIMVHDLQPLQRQDQRMPDLIIPTKPAGEFGLSSAVYDHDSSTICICSSAAQENPWLMDRTCPRIANRIAHNNFSTFPGEQIQCAVVVPGTIPQIAMVNHSNEVFILRFESGRWKARQIKVRMETGRRVIVKADEKMSIAAMDGAIRLFWMNGQNGEMLTIHNIETKQGYQFQSKKITTPF